MIGCSRALTSARECSFWLVHWLKDAPERFGPARAAGATPLAGAKGDFADRLPARNYNRIDRSRARVGGMAQVCPSGTLRLLGMKKEPEFFGLFIVATRSLVSGRALKVVGYDT